MGVFSFMVFFGLSAFLLAFLSCTSPLSHFSGWLDIGGLVWRCSGGGKLADKVIITSNELLSQLVIIITIIIIIAI